MVRPHSPRGRRVSHPFFAYLYRLRFIQRWSLMRNTVPENVAEHSYYVALLTHALCEIGRTVYGREVDAGSAVIAALFHDVEEVMTGDIPTPVKHHNQRLLNSLREMETVAAERLLETVPAPLTPVYAPLIGPEATGADAYRWVKAADKLAAYLKCQSELAAGNREFAVAARQLEDAVHALAMPEVEYFLEHFAPAFSQTLDEISELD
jgi:5'-deoxynucleotidase